MASETVAGRRLEAVRRAELLLGLWQDLSAVGDVPRALRLANRRLRGTAGADLAIREVVVGPAAQWLLGRDREPAVDVALRSVTVPIRRRMRLLGALHAACSTDPAGNDDRRPPDIDLVVGMAEVFAGVIERDEAKAELARRAELLARLHDWQQATMHDLAALGDVIGEVEITVAAAVDPPVEARIRHRLSAVLGEISGAQRSIRRTARGLRYLQSWGDDLGPSLQHLARISGRTGALAVNVGVRGDPAPLDVTSEEALFGLAVDWLLSAEFDARASLVSILLEHGSGAVTLKLRDDGIGLSHRTAFGQSWALRALQRRVAEAGGQLGLRPASPRGVEAAAVFPAGRPR